MQKNRHLKCSHCGKKVQVFYVDGSRQVELDYDDTAKLHVLRKKT